MPFKRARAFLAADDEKVARSDRRAGEIVSGFEGLQRNAKAAGDFLQGVPHANFVPARAGRSKLRFRLPGELIGGDAIEELFHLGLRSDWNFEQIRIVAGRSRITTKLRIE